jgi:hypothetical protein
VSGLLLRRLLNVHGLLTVTLLAVGAGSRLPAVALLTVHGRMSIGAGSGLLTTTRLRGLLTVALLTVAGLLLEGLLLEGLLTIRGRLSVGAGFRRLTVTLRRGLLTAVTGPVRGRTRWFRGRTGPILGGLLTVRGRLTVRTDSGLAVALLAVGRPGERLAVPLLSLSGAGARL